MYHLTLVGIGSGNPSHLTRQAVSALNRAEVILLPRKGEDKSDLADLRRALLADLVTEPVRVVEYDVPNRADTPDYLQAVTDWHDRIAGIWAEAMAEHLPKGGQVALLVWGDPSLYDSTLRIAARLPAVTTEVIPGITSLQLLTAAHCIALNTLGEAVIITTGRRLREGGWPEGAETVAVMLDSGGAFTALDPAGIRIWWGAYVGMAQERLIAGDLAEVSDRIVATRAELRAEHGWIMDIYLLRRGDEA
ncbi:MAG: precorrin-6A synthase (deacetylating) [Tabrizicola sp.]|nr:precorrin-6A synthase (deacetylating) [Tabrizicola sp.]